MSKNIDFTKMTMDDFYNFVNDYQIIKYQNEARLIPGTNIGLEISLTSVFLKSLCLIKEFRELIFKDINVKTYSRYNIRAFTEVSFPEAKYGKSETDKYGLARIDGMLLAERNNTIYDSIFFEMKNKNNNIDVNQFIRYRELANELKISKFVTVSNQYVTISTQLPIDIAKKGNIELYHLSWPYIMSKALILLYKNDINIEDEDQVNIMKEVVRYFRDPNSGISEYTSMTKSWKPALKNICNHVSINSLNNEKKQEIDNTVDSWIQEEKDLAVQLSTRLGAVVSIKIKKEHTSLKARQSYVKIELINKGLFESEFIIPNVISTLKIVANCQTKAINMYVTIKDEKSNSSPQQLRYVRDQLKRCWKKDPANFEFIMSNLFLYVNIKNTNRQNVIPLCDFIKHEDFNADGFNEIISFYKDINIKCISVALQKQLGQDFYSSNKFVQLYESTVVEFYKIIISYLENQKAPAPTIDIEIDESTETAN